MVVTTHHNGENVEEKHPLRRDRKALRHGMEQAIKPLTVRRYVTVQRHQPLKSQKALLREAANADHIPASSVDFQKLPLGDQARRKGARRSGHVPQQPEKLRVEDRGLNLKTSSRKRQAPTRRIEERNIPREPRFCISTKSTRNLEMVWTVEGSISTSGRGLEEVGMEGRGRANSDTIREGSREGTEGQQTSTRALMVAYRT